MKERGREKETDRQREIQKDRQKDRQTVILGQRERERVREIGRETCDVCSIPRSTIFVLDSILF